MKIRRSFFAALRKAVRRKTSPSAAAFSAASRNEETMEDNKWIQIKVTSKVENLDSLCAVMSMLSNGLQIEDYSDIEDRILDGVYGDLIDESVLNADRTVASVSIYVPADKPTEHYTMFIKEKLDALKIESKTELISLCEEDWANSWKQYYKPIKIGNRLVVVPMWEKYKAEPHEIVVSWVPVPNAIPGSILTTISPFDASYFSHIGTTTRRLPILIGL